MPSKLSGAAERIRRLGTPRRDEHDGGAASRSMRQPGWTAGRAALRVPACRVTSTPRLAGTHRTSIGPGSRAIGVNGRSVTPMLGRGEHGAETVGKRGSARVVASGGTGEQHLR
jgi:hypothetical protein